MKCFVVFSYKTHTHTQVCLGTYAATYPCTP